MHVKHVETKPISYNRIVKHTRQGNIHEIMAYDHKSTGSGIIKIDQEHYIDFAHPLATSESDIIESTRNRIALSRPDIDLHLHSNGYLYELKKYKATENRAQSPNEIRRTFKRLRSIINTNVTDPRRCKFITLTYSENMTDPVALKSDLSAFTKRFKRFVSGLCNKKGHNLGLTFEYISICEPQGRGAWHAHIIFIFNKIVRYISNDDVYRIWTSGSSQTKRGFTTTRKIDNVDNVGAYLTAYLADVEISELDHRQVSFLSDQTDICIKECNVPDYDSSGNPSGKKSKRFIKGGRLHLYPKGFHIYRCSKGIKRPEIVYQTYGDVLNELGISAALTFSKSVHITDNNNYSNTLTYMFYNTKRKTNKRKDARTSYREILRCANEFSSSGAWAPPQVYQFDSESALIAECNTASILAELHEYNYEVMPDV